MHKESLQSILTKYPYKVFSWCFAAVTSKVLLQKGLCWKRSSGWDLSACTSDSSFVPFPCDEVIDEYLRVAPGVFCSWTAFRCSRSMLVPCFAVGFSPIRGLGDASAGSPATGQTAAAWALETSRRSLIWEWLMTIPKNGWLNTKHDPFLWVATLEPWTSDAFDAFPSIK